MTLAKVQKAIEDAKQHSAGEPCFLEISWTAEEWLGELKRRGKIKHFRQVKDWEDDNQRRYLIEW